MKVGSVILGDISWFIRDGTKELQEFDTTLLLTEIIQIQYQADRFSTLPGIPRRYKVSQGKFRVVKILEDIYRFYTGEMTTDAIARIATTNDALGYCNAAKDAWKSGTVLHREEIMGDCMYFEGLRYLGNLKTETGEDIMTFQLMLGS